MRNCNTFTQNSSSKGDGDGAGGDDGGSLNINTSI